MRCIVATDDQRGTTRPRPPPPSLFASARSFDCVCVTSVTADNHRLAAAVFVATSALCATCMHRHQMSNDNFDLSPWGIRVGVVEHFHKSVVRLIMCVCVFVCPFPGGTVAPSEWPFIVLNLKAMPEFAQRPSTVCIGGTMNAGTITPFITHSTAAVVPGRN